MKFYKSVLQPYRLSFMLLAVSVALTACNSDHTVSIPPKQGADRVWAIESNVHAANLVVGDEVQLAIKSLDINGNPITPENAPTYTSDDSGIVSVDSAGKIRAIEKTPGIRIIASVKSAGVTLRDTIHVAVFDTPVNIASVKFTTYSGNPLSPIVTYKSYASFKVTIKDSDGFEVYDLSYSIKSLDKGILDADRFSLYGNRVGQTKVVVDVHGFGEHFTDTLDIKVLYPTQASILMFGGAMSDIVAVGGTATFENYLYPSLAVDIVFDPTNPAVLAGGDILNLEEYESATRTFTVPGVYRYTAPGTNTSGVILVRENPTF